MIASKDFHVKTMHWQCMTRAVTEQVADYCLSFQSSLQNKADIVLLRSELKYPCPLLQDML